MLRITQVNEDAPSTTFKLEGKLVGPWVDELAQVCGEQSPLQGRPQLDLTAVTFIDGAGVTLLRDLLARGAVLTSCSGLVAELLQRGS